MPASNAFTTSSGISSPIILLSLAIPPPNPILTLLDEAVSSSRPGNSVLYGTQTRLRPAL